ncbi:MAG TPA: hypothetical protein VFL91_21325 [Thermomicrobiales bacterium]|nr:hypothetical protein [Thermomicrobiales bacterium]
MTITEDDFATREATEQYLLAHPETLNVWRRLAERDAAKVRACWEGVAYVENRYAPRAASAAGEACPLGLYLQAEGAEGIDVCAPSTVHFARYLGLIGDEAYAEPMDFTSPWDGGALHPSVVREHVLALVDEHEKGGAR